MAQKVASIFAEIGIDSSKFERGAKSVGGLLSDLVEGFGSLNPVAAAAGSGLIALAGYLQESVKAAAASNEVMAKQAQILEATGYAANIAGFEMQAMADELSRLSGVDDEVIAGAQSMMLTFRNIGREEFPRAMQAALDLSTTFGGLEASSMQLGKALNDPVKGVTALARSGVTFSQQQQDQIKNFVETNDLASAQAIILAEIENQVGGTAQAIEQAGDGSARLNVALGNLSEGIGNQLLPIQRAWNDSLSESVEGVNELIDAGENLTTAQNRAQEMFGLTDDQLRRARQSSKEFSAEYENLVNQFRRGSEMTEYATKLFLAMGGSLADLNGIIRENVDVAEVDEDAIKELTRANQDYLKLIDDVGNMQQSFADKQAGFAKKRVDIEAEIAEKIKQGYWEQGSVIQDLRADLAELDVAEAESAAAAELAGKRKILSMLEQQLASDGLTARETEALLRLGNQWGIYSDEAIKEARAAMAVVAELSNTIAGLPDVKNIRINIDAQTGGNLAATNELMRYETRDSGGPGVAGQPYVINPQAGPEVFIPQTNGQFIPNADRLTGGGQSIDYDRLTDSMVQAMARAGMVR